jgi:SAM-dependent methyltransferase
MKSAALLFLAALQTLHHAAPPLKHPHLWETLAAGMAAPVLPSFLGALAKTRLRCRFCGVGLGKPFLDLGRSPLANSNLRREDLAKPEPSFPLRLRRCASCGLVQQADFADAGSIFNEHYAYFASYSESWLRHAREYAAYAVRRFGLGPGSRVVEAASNDGYLLQYFKEHGIPVLGVEPSRNVAEAAIKKGIPTRVEFFGEDSARRLAREEGPADLFVANNVLAHVPNVNGFVKGIAAVLKPEGTATLEFPHFLRLVEGAAFDTVYHEHFSYFSIDAAERIFARHGLVVFDVEELATHGGSLRLYVRRSEDASRPVSDAVVRVRETERRAGLFESRTYAAFARRVEEVRRELLRFLHRARDEGKTVVGYGAPAKGNTLLNYCGVTADLVRYTVDASPHKQGLFLPGSHLEIFPPSKIFETRPDYVLILPWNLREEITGQMRGIAEWGGRFVIAIPKLEVLG